jgi:cobalt-zinc-cadmium efflux system outer membrane protein
VFQQLLIVFCAVTIARGAALEDLVRAAIERNREILALRQRAVEAGALLRQAGVRPAPAVEIEGTTGRPLGTRGSEEYAVGFSYPIETAGKRDKRLRVARLSLDLAEAELAERVRQIRLQLASRYIEAAADRQKVAALGRLLELDRDAERLTNARVEEGDAAPLERDLLVADLNRNEAQRVLLAGRTESALVELRSLAGLAAADAIEVELDGVAQAPTAGLDELKKRALEIRPDLRIARLLERQGAAEVQLAQAESRPDITLGARYARTSEQFDQLGLNASGQPVAIRDRDNLLSFAASVPLFTGRRGRASVEAAEARAAGARLRREHLENAIALEVEAAWRRREAAKSMLEVLDRGVLRQSEKNLAIIRQAHLLGQLRMLDVVNERRRLVDTEMSYIDARAGLARAAAELEHAAGGGLP